MAWTWIRHPSRTPLDAFERECRFTFSRASGPGGQHRNKVETAVVALHVPTGIEAAAAETRSQRQNRERAILRLRTRIAVMLPVFPEPADEIPSPLWQSRCRGGRIECNDEHNDFPALLAEACVALRGGGFDIKTAAERLRCTATQLLKFVGKSHEARELMAAERARRGLPRLRF